MSRIRFFQLLVAASAAFYLTWAFLPFVPRNLSPALQEILTWDRYGSVPLLLQPVFYLAIGTLKLIASLGLFLFLSWGRWLFAGVLVLSIALVPFSGIFIVLPLDGLVGNFTTLIHGAIIALAFSSPIAECWRKDE